MQDNKMKWFGGVCAGVLILGTGWAIAQEGDPAAAAEEAAPAAEEVPAAPAVPVKPRPSEIMPLASKTLLLDVVNNGKRFFAVGQHGIILASNNGKDWAQVQAPVRSPLTAIHFADENNGWIVGHDATILHTSDGGKNWKLQNFQPELEKPFLDVYFIDSSIGIAVGAYGLMYRTTDGGSTWAEQPADSIRADEVHFTAINRLANGTLMLVGEQGMMGISADAGVTWEKLDPVYEGTLFGVQPVGESGAMVYGLRGNAYYSTAVKSAPFAKFDTQTENSLYGGGQMADGRVIMVGLNGSVYIADPVAGSISAFKVTTRETDRLGRDREKLISSSFSAAAPLSDRGVVAVGEQGAFITSIQ